MFENSLGTPEDTSWHEEAAVQLRRWFKERDLDWAKKAFQNPPSSPFTKEIGEAPYSLNMFNSLANILRSLGFTEQKFNIYHLHDHIPSILKIAFLQKTYLKARNRSDYAKKPEIYNKRNYEHYKTKKEKVDQIKIEAGCKVCGEKDPQVLDFHHRDPKTKEFAIGWSVSKYNWDRIQQEIEKCDILCANCHRRFTRSQHTSKYEKE